MLKSIKIGQSEINRVDHVGLDGRKQIVYADQNLGGFKIICSAKGMDVMGLVITSHAQLQALAKLIGEAWPQAERLKPQIATSSKGTLPDPVV